jgi:hypothetical protein
LFDVAAAIHSFANRSNSVRFFCTSKQMQNFRTNQFYSFCNKFISNHNAILFRLF